MRVASNEMSRSGVCSRRGRAAVTVCDYAVTVTNYSGLTVRRIYRWEVRELDG